MSAQFYMGIKTATYEQKVLQLPLHTVLLQNVRKKQKSGSLNPEMYGGTQTAVLSDYLPITGKVTMTSKQT